MSKLTKKEIKANRKEFSKNPFKYMIAPEIETWKKQPLKQIGRFFFGFLSFYIVFVMLQAINYDIMYCDSNLDQFDGKMMDTYNNFINYTNEKIDNYDNPIIVNGNLVDDNYAGYLAQDTINCTYNLKRWWYDDKDVLKNFKIIGVNRWYKNMN